MDSGKTQQMPNEEPNWQECEHEPVEDAGNVTARFCRLRFCRLCGVVYWDKRDKTVIDTNPQECDETETVRNIPAKDYPELQEAIRRFEQGFGDVRSTICNRTPAGASVRDFAVGFAISGRALEDKNRETLTNYIAATAKQYERDVNDWLSLEAKEPKEGYVLYWRERPNFWVRTFKGASYTYERWGLWWRCAVEPCEKTVSETESRS